MRWLNLTIFTLILLGLEQGMSVALAKPGAYGASPTLLLILAVFTALTAPAMAALWTCLILGLLHDLVHPVMTPDLLADVAIIGPGALGYLMGGYALLKLRGVVYRGSPVAIAVFTFVAGIFVHLVIVLLFSLRGVSFLLLPGERLVEWQWAGEIVGRFLSLAYTALLALPIGWALLRVSEKLGHDTLKAGKGPRR